MNERQGLWGWCSLDLNSVFASQQSLTLGGDLTSLGRSALICTPGIQAAPSIHSEKLASLHPFNKHSLSCDRLLALGRG